MFAQVLAIAQYILDSFIHIWPYLLVTIPLAVAVKMSGASRHINRAFKARPIIAIFLATIVGAFSPFCSCGVIPIIAALLIGGVPLAPVMSFWLASPSMDPEIFFLSVGTLGWELAVWRLLSTLVLSLGGGFITYLFVQRGWLGDNLLRSKSSTRVKSSLELLKGYGHSIVQRLDDFSNLLIPKPTSSLSPEATCCSSSNGAFPIQSATLEIFPMSKMETALGGIGASTVKLPQTCGLGDCNTNSGSKSLNDCDTPGDNTCQTAPPSFSRRLLTETWQATAMVVKFMALAFFLTALIKFYVPSEWIITVLGANNPWAILTAAMLGVPVYTSNLTALPMVSGLLFQGMNPAAALAFLVVGPTTTLPAMAAVWGLVSRRVFALYVSISLVGAVALGYLYSWVV